MQDIINLASEVILVSTDSFSSISVIISLVLLVTCFIAGTVNVIA